MAAELRRSLRQNSVRYRAKRKGEVPATGLRCPVPRQQRKCRVTTESFLHRAPHPPATKTSCGLARPSLPSCSRPGLAAGPPRQPLTQPPAAPPAHAAAGLSRHRLFKGGNASRSHQSIIASDAPRETEQRETQDRRRDSRRGRSGAAVLGSFRGPSPGVPHHAASEPTAPAPARITKGEHSWLRKRSRCQVTFSFGLIGPGMVTWPHRAPGNAGKCSLRYWQPFCCGRREARTSEDQQREVQAPRWPTSRPRARALPSSTSLAVPGPRDLRSQAAPSPSCSGGNRRSSWIIPSPRPAIWQQVPSAKPPISLHIHHSHHLLLPGAGSHLPAQRPTSIPSSPSQTTLNLHSQCQS